MAEAVVKRSISLPAELAKRVDEARGEVPLSRWLATASAQRLARQAEEADGVRAVTSQVGRSGADDGRGPRGARRGPAPSSASAKAAVKPRPKATKR